MSIFGVSAIRRNIAGTEVESCMVHSIRRDGGSFVACYGTATPIEEVASSILAGYEFFVLTCHLGERFRLIEREHIHVKTGQTKYLYSRPRNSLFQLPAF